MNNKQIAQVKGSFTNWMISHPSAASDFLAQYDEATAWLNSSGVPSGSAVGGSYYFNIDNGDIYKNDDGSPNSNWSYICNYFDAHSTRIIPLKILYTDFNSGTSPVTSFAYDYFVLKPNEQITGLWLEQVSNFEASGNPALSLVLLDEPDSVELASVLDSIGLEVPYCYSDAYNNMFLFQQPGQVFGRMSNIHAGSGRQIQLIISSADLTIFTGGNYNLYVRVETFRSL